MIIDNDIVEIEGRYGETVFPYDDVTIIKGNFKQQILDGQKALEEMKNLKLAFGEPFYQVLGKYYTLQEANQKLEKVIQNLRELIDIHVEEKKELRKKADLWDEHDIQYCKESRKQ